MIKLVVSDLDGTILPYSDKRLSDKIIGKIHEIVDSGIIFGISSGRTYKELESLFQGLVNKIYLTCCDGALTIKNGKLLYSRKIEISELKPFFESKVPDFSFVLHGMSENYCFGNTPSEADIYKCKKIKSVYEINDKIYKITSYGGRMDFPFYSGIRMHWDGGENNAAQYVNRYCNKGVALSDLQMRLMLTKYDTAVLGDRGNDVCMVKNSAVSYCIGNRCSELSEICTFAYNDGLDALEHIILMTEL